MKTARALCALALAAALLCSCSKAAAYYRVAAGNYAYERGDYQEANIDYLEAEHDRPDAGYIAYDIGNVYHSLGEGEAAGAQWAAAASSSDSGLRASALFNEGIFAFELGRYRDAYEDFRRVVETVPGDIDAKRNLELSYEKMSARPAPGGPGAPIPVASSRGDRKADRELQFVRDKEDQRWKAAASAPSPPAAEDW